MKEQEGFIPYAGYQTYYRIAGECTDGRLPLLVLHGGPGAAHYYLQTLDGIAELKSICNDIRDKDSGKDVYLTVEELCAYHPDHPSQQTVRRWKRLGYFPYYKDGETRRVKFKKSEIDAWIASSRHMSRQERNALHDAQILARRRQMEIGGLDDE